MSTHRWIPDETMQRLVGMLRHQCDLHQQSLMQRHPWTTGHILAWQHFEPSLELVLTMNATIESLDTLRMRGDGNDRKIIVVKP